MKAKFFPILLMVLFLGLATFTWALEPAGKTLRVDPQTAEFSTPTGLPDCAKMTPLSGDPGKGAFVILIKASAGCMVPWHWHTFSEDLMVVSGSGKVEMKDDKPFILQPGGYVSMPGHHIHQASFMADSMMFLSSDGAFDIHYVNKKGKEIPVEKALKKAEEAK
jgi:quercetin dioxygenase-like cupin family protein